MRERNYKEIFELTAPPGSNESFARKIEARTQRVRPVFNPIYGLSAALVAAVVLCGGVMLALGQRDDIGGGVYSGGDTTIATTTETIPTGEVNPGAAGSASAGSAPILVDADSALTDKWRVEYAADGIHYVIAGENYDNCDNPCDTCECLEAESARSSGFAHFCSRATSCDCLFTPWMFERIERRSDTRYVGVITSIFTRDGEPVDWNYTMNVLEDGTLEFDGLVLKFTTLFRDAEVPVVIHTELGQGVAEIYMILAEEAYDYVDVEGALTSIYIREYENEHGVIHPEIRLDYTTGCDTVGEATRSKTVKFTYDRHGTRVIDNGERITYIPTVEAQEWADSTVVLFSADGWVETNLLRVYLEPNLLEMYFDFPEGISRYNYTYADELSFRFTDGSVRPIHAAGAHGDWRKDTLAVQVGLGDMVDITKIAAVIINGKEFVVRGGENE
jgi:hypothetical protein